jgi:hypothetical protein
VGQITGQCMGDTGLAEAIALAKSGHRQEAQKAFISILRSDPNDLVALLWMGHLADEKRIRQRCLERVLSLDPGNPHAKKGLALLSAKPAPNLENADSIDSVSSESSEPALALEGQLHPNLPKASSGDMDQSRKNATGIRALFAAKPMAVIGGLIAALGATLPYANMSIRVDEIRYPAGVLRGYETTSGLLVLIGSVLLVAAILSLDFTAQPRLAFIPLLMAVVLGSLALQDSSRDFPCDFGLLDVFIKQAGGKLPDGSCTAVGNGPSWVLFGLFILAVSSLVLATRRKQGKDIAPQEI